MVRIQVSEHRLINIRRSSLCDNCSVHNCTSLIDSRVTECTDFRPMFSVFMKCRECGRIYDPYRSLCSLDYELCPECNHSENNAPSITFVCRE
jgi:hypothetical protein